ncbi:tripartite tricarboxylate transporter permease [Bacillus sp. FJAT-49705]|uniref:Tripartite tricarboxylate transporter permease n=1 Tax=Cytobacillus citreus TaxID=2833586 RepID=A0ABS5NXJ6_9BACI|nr:tripartite tricarboxylate transporter permease [Cytobacillus citreus]MBS4192336.1 tripartite tricarboxylate transporter permease [Cytobacillus citreus]
MVIEGFRAILSIDVIFIIFAGVLLGIVVGSLPGLTATMTIALLLPFSFGLSPVSSIALMVSVFIGGMYGGSVTAILLSIPGTPAAAATVLDGYPLRKQGKIGKAISTATIASFSGGIVSVTCLIFFSPILADFALKFSAAEFFALAVFGLSIIASVSGNSPIKGLIAACLGLLIAMVGMDPLTAYPRFTFGTTQLMGGFSLIPALIGLFGVAEILGSIVEKNNIEEKIKVKLDNTIITLREGKGLIGTILRSSFIGTFIGAIPGAGADIAAFVSYNEAKRWSKNKDEFGKGNLKGVAAPEAGNNGVTGGTMIPLLTLGIPGDAAAAVLLGAFLIHGLQPGPKLFMDNGELVYGIFAAMIVANIFMLVLGLSTIKVFAKVLQTDTKILMPIILVLTTVGAFAINNSMFDVYVMLGFGVLGYFMRKMDIPTSPIVLAIILGPMAEENFRRAAMLNEKSLSFLYDRPITVIFLLLAIITVSSSYMKYIKDRKK